MAQHSVLGYGPPYLLFQLSGQLKTSSIRYGHQALNGFSLKRFLLYELEGGASFYVQQQNPIY